MGSHGPLLQKLISCVKPPVGTPHSFACLTRFRLRNLIPPLHDTEQFPQADQELHFPSMGTHSGVPHLCMAHDVISFPVFAGHASPLPLGDLAISLRLAFCPPPQERVQPPQSAQSSHLQSTS